MNTEFELPEHPSLALVEELAEKSWACGLNWLDHEGVESARFELKTLDEQRQLTAAGIGRGRDRINAAVRGARSFWFDEQVDSPVRRRLVQQLDELRTLLNRVLFLPLAELEVQYAVYPVGGFYRRHLDNLTGDYRRFITFVLYLNHWQPGDGGQLRLHLPEGTTDIDPVGGSLVLFKSHDVPHEVLMTNVERYSITGWFRLR